MNCGDSDKLLLLFGVLVNADKGDSQRWYNVRTTLGNIGATFFFSLILFILFFSFSAVGHRVTKIVLLSISYCYVYWTHNFVGFINSLYWHLPLQVVSSGICSVLSEA